MTEHLLNAVVLGICVSLGEPSATQAPCGPEDHTRRVCSKIQAEEAPDKSEYTKTPSPACKGSHSVTLSWKASASLSSSHVQGEGYNLYRWKRGGVCTKIKELLERPAYEDCSVEEGQKYRYAVTAVKQLSESEPSNVVEALIQHP
jgi:hypothetical protein